MTKPRLLLVDDEEELVTTLMERLQWRGLEAVATTSGPDALERLRAEPFDVAVIDLKMPGIDGLDLRDRIHREFPGVRVILVTGHGRDASNPEGHAEGDQEILLKPFDLDVLIDMITPERGE